MLASATYVLLVYFSCGGGSCGTPQQLELCIASQVDGLIIRCDGKNDTNQYRPRPFPSLRACSEAGKLMRSQAASPSKTVSNYRCIKRSASVG